MYSIGKTFKQSIHKRKGRRCRVSSTLKSTIRRKHFLSLGCNEEKAMTLHDGQLDMNLASIVNRKEIATVRVEKKRCAIHTTKLHYSELFVVLANLQATIA
jgi:hypothetical protein